jgi:DNA-binding transcriptional regulator LsrR (DeoR family)
MSYNQEFMFKVGNLYYKDNLTQDSIAKLLKISRHEANRLLKKHYMKASYK